MAVRCLFIDSAVPNPQNLLATLEEGTSVHWLDPKTDGLHQIATTLAGFQQLETILIFAHGAPGAIQLGKLSLTEATLGRYAEELAAIGESLTPDGGVQFYACDLGQGQKGEAFVTALEEAIGAPCAAASTLVGHSDLGGNWSLDVGTLSAPTFANPQWQGLLGLTVPATEAPTLDAAEESGEMPMPSRRCGPMAPSSHGDIQTVAATAAGWPAS